MTEQYSKLETMDDNIVSTCSFFFERLSILNSMWRGQLNLDQKYLEFVLVQ